LGLDDFSWLWNTIKVFPRYALHEKIAILAAIPLLVYVAYLLTAGRPPLVVYNLVVSPAINIGGHDPRNIAPGERIELWLNIENNSELEIQNIQGQFWTSSKYLIQASRAPAYVVTGKPDQFLYYDISIPLLQKHSAEFLATWIVTVPSGDDSIPIGYSVVSSQTEWQSGGWYFAREGKGVKMIDWPQGFGPKKSS
jgi:hypothetical protein